MIFLNIFVFESQKQQFSVMYSISVIFLCFPFCGKFAALSYTLPHHFLLPEPIRHYPDVYILTSADQASYAAQTRISPDSLLWGHCTLVHRAVVSWNSAWLPVCHTAPANKIEEECFFKNKLSIVACKVFWPWGTQELKHSTYKTSYLLLLVKFSDLGSHNS